jgi:DNA (cytosine-5)-methyltransferase 1
MKTIHSLDLFCGAGGLSTGMKSAGIKVEAAFDSDADSIHTYNNNVEPVAKVVDIFELLGSSDLLKLKGVDLVAGGPPCQGFCLINPKRAVNDPRNSCLDAFLYVIDFLKPQYVLMENVTGLISLGGGFALKKLDKFFFDSGYKYSYKVLQAAHYGIPQSRWRFILLASLSETPLFPTPTHYAKITPNFAKGRELTLPLSNDLFTRLGDHVTVCDAIFDLPPIQNGGKYSGKYIEGDNISHYAEDLRSPDGIISHHETRKLSDIQMSRVRALKNPGENWTNLPKNLLPGNLARLFEKYGKAMGSLTRFRRLEWEKLFSTIVTSPDPYWGAFIHPRDDRVLSVREFARAQGFPDRFDFSGSLTSRYRQIGNAVPPHLASAVASSAFQNGK